MIPRKVIWNSLRRRGIIILENYVQTDNVQSEVFQAKEGIRQEGVLSPTLFNIVSDDAIKEVKGIVITDRI